MRWFLIATVCVAITQCLLGGAARGQQSEEFTNFQPMDYADLKARIEQLEANSASAPPEAYYQSAPCPEPGALYFQYDAVVVAPMLAQNSAFVAQLADANTRNVPFSLGLDYSSRFELGYLAPTGCIGWRARYWHFNAGDQVGLADDANGLIADDAVALSVGANIDDVDTITRVTYGLKVDVVDSEFTRQNGSGLFAFGLRYAQFRQRYFADTDEGILNTDLDSFGIGPTLAYEWRARSRQSVGLSFVAGGRASLLYGSQKINSFETDDDSIYRYDAASPFYNVEAQLGWEYRSASGLFGRIGLEAQYWGNVGNATNHNTNGTSDDVEDIVGGSILGDGIGFVGFAASVGYIW